MAEDSNLISHLDKPVEPRIPIAIISNSQTPYRLHLHRRIAREMPAIRLWSLYTHETSNSNWQFEAPAEIGPVLFGKGENCLGQDQFRNALKEWRRGGAIIRWLREHEVKFVVMMGYNDAGRMRIIRWCRNHRVPCYLFGDSNIHGDNGTALKALVKKWVVGWVVKSCTGVLACGRFGEAYFRKYGARPDRIFFFPYEPDYELIQNLPPETIERAMQSFGLAFDRRRIVYSGRLIQIKRVDLLIAAFAAIATARPNWDLIIVGDGPLKQSLQGQMPREFHDRVKWIGFLDDQITVSAIYRASDVLVLPSDYEPWALVINEAVAAGLAVVSSNVVGASGELVQDGVNGRLFPPADLSKLIECLLDVTDPMRIDTYKAASADILTAWRDRGDPVAGLWNALGSVGIQQR